MAVGDNKFADIVERRLRVMSSFVNCQSRDCSETALKLLRNCSNQQDGSGQQYVISGYW